MNLTAIKGPTKVDSTRLSIPFDECEIINTNLIDEIRSEKLNLDTGEVISSDVKTGIVIWEEKRDGTTIKFWVDNQFSYIDGIRTAKEYITFLVNSKHLKERYFEGITINTLPEIYDYLMNLGIVKFSYESLLNSRYNDTDICVDFNSTPEQFNVLKSNIKSMSSHSELWFTATGQKDNSGIWTGTKRKPRESATPGKPFIKFYSKDEDFNGKSLKFAESYISPDLYSNLFRVEATIKNSKHKSHLGISSAKTFGAFLHLDLQLLLQQLVKEFFISEKKLVMNSGELTPIEKVIIDLMNELISKGSTNSELFAIFNRSDVSRQAKGILKEKYHKLTSLDEFNRKQLDLNSTSKDVLSYLGISG